MKLQGCPCGEVRGSVSLFFVCENERVGHMRVYICVPLRVCTPWVGVVEGKGLEEGEERSQVTVAQESCFDWSHIPAGC